MAGIGHLLAAVAFRQHHHARAVGLQQINVRVHAAGSGWAEGAGSVTGWRFCRARVVDRVIFDVLRQRLAVVDKLLQLGVGDVACHDNGAVKAQAGGDQMCRQLRQDLAHRLIQVDAYHLAFAGLTQMFRDIFSRIALQLLDPDTVAVDFRLDVAVGGAGDAHADRAGGAVARQTDHPDIVGEVFPAELRAEAEVLRFLQQLLLQLHVAERLTVFVTFGRQTVVIAGRGQFDGLQRRFRRGAADHKRDVVRRAGGGAESAHLLNEVVFQLRRGDQGLGFLVQIGFVGGTAAFRHAQELIFFTVDAIEIDLRRQVGAGVNLFIHIQRRVL